ncbi:MAG: DUF1016 family protein [Kiritimatiellae bacterium]|nr:DUF1016 family protein [Kiritimatiellia bacterium]
MRAVNAELVIANWNIGRHIVEFEQGGKARAEYGKELLKRLAVDLTARYGRGFSRSKLIYMRLFYLMFPKGATASHLLSWSHYLEILKVEDALARDFYVNECERAGWGVRELRRQIESSLFERYALSRDKKGVLALANKGAEPARPEDIVREPFVFEFTGINPVRRYTEKSLESRLCARLEDFMLELGKGYSFVGRQYAMQIGASRFKVDLVFYNRFLRCFVLIDLKRKGVTHRDIGQMNLYLNYFQNEESAPDDNPPIGILLGSIRDNVVVEYAMQGITNKLFVARYQLYMPDREQLRRELAYMLKSESSPKSKAASI